MNSKQDNDYEKFTVDDLLNESDSSENDIAAAFRKTTRAENINQNALLEDHQAVMNDLMGQDPMHDRVFDRSLEHDNPYSKE